MLSCTIRSIKTRHLKNSLFRGRSFVATSKENNTPKYMSQFLFLVTAPLDTGFFHYRRVFCTVLYKLQAGPHYYCSHISHQEHRWVTECCYTHCFYKHQHAHHQSKNLRVRIGQRQFCFRLSIHTYTIHKMCIIYVSISN